MGLRPPLPVFERTKRSLFLVGLAAAMEFVDPLPFFKSPGPSTLLGGDNFDVLLGVK